MLMMIANIKDKNNKIKYIRLLDVYTGRVEDVHYDKLVQLDYKFNGHVINLVLRYEKLVGINGSLDRYTSMDTSYKLLGNEPIVIIGISGDNTFICTNYTGVMKNLTREQIVEYGKIHGIANGKNSKQQTISY